MMLAILLGALIAQNVQGTACTGALPVVASATVAQTMPEGALNDYQMRVTVTNRGTRAQAGNTLQSVDIFRDGIKVDQKGIPPLKPGESYTFPYSYARNSDAGDGTTRFRFKLDMRQPGDTPECGPGSEVTLRV